MLTALRFEQAEIHTGMALKQATTAWLNSAAFEMNHNRFRRYHAVKALLDLPDDVVLLIFSRLYPTSAEFDEEALRKTRDALNFSQTCWRLNRLFRRTRRAFVEAPRTLNLQYPAPQHAILRASQVDIEAATFILCQGRGSLRSVRLTALGEAHLEIMALLYRCESIRELQFVDGAPTPWSTARGEMGGALSLLAFVPRWFGQRLRRLVLLKPSRETIRAFANTLCSPSDVSVFRIAPAVMREATKEDLPRLLRRASCFSMSFAEDLPLEQAHHFVRKLRASLWAIRRHLPSVRLVDRAGGARFTRHARVRFVRDEKVRLSEWISGLDGLQRFPPAAAFDPTMRERLMMEVDTFAAAESVVRGRVSLACPMELQIQAGTCRTVSGQALFMRNGSEGTMVFAAAFNVARQIGANEVVLSTEVAGCAEQVMAQFGREAVGGWFGARRSAGWCSTGEKVRVGVVGERADSGVLSGLAALIQVVQLVGARALWMEDVRLHLDGRAQGQRVARSIRDAMRAAARAEAAGVSCGSLRGVLERWLALPHERLL